MHKNDAHVDDSAYVLSAALLRVAVPQAVEGLAQGRAQALQVLALVLVAEAGEEGTWCTVPEAHTEIDCRFVD